MAPGRASSVKIVRAWRISGDDQGAHMFFHPDREVPMLRDLTADEVSVRVDRMGSVSALAEAEGAARTGQIQLFDGGDPHGS